jgi:hypothetical protein
MNLAPLDSKWKWIIAAPVWGRFKLFRLPDDRTLERRASGNGRDLAAIGKPKQSRLLTQKISNCCNLGRPEMASAFFSDSADPFNTLPYRVVDRCLSLFSVSTTSFNLLNTIFQFSTECSLSFSVALLSWETMTTVLFPCFESS